jgi:hypothetical protein
MSKKKKKKLQKEFQENRKAGYYVEITNGVSVPVSGIALEKRTGIERVARRQKTRLQNRFAMRRKHSWLVLHADGQAHEWQAGNVKFKERVPLVELLTYGIHPLLLKIAKARAQQEAR